MADGYRIIGAEMSPYSVKVRSYFRYKAIPHQWVLRDMASRRNYEEHAVIPLVVTSKVLASRIPRRSSQVASRGCVPR